MTRPLAPGDVIHGFAHGAFGRDHYHCCRIEAVGPDWIVTRDIDEPDHAPDFASGERSLTLCLSARDKPCQYLSDDEPGTCPVAPPADTARPQLTTWSQP